MGIEYAAHADDERAQHPRHPAHPDDVHAHDRGGALFFARGAQLQPGGGLLEPVGDEDEEERPGQRVPERGVLLHAEEGARAVGHFLPVDEDRVRDDQQRQRGDDRGRARQPHEREADDGRQNRGDGRADEQRGQEGQVHVLEHRVELAQRQRLGLGRHGEEDRAVGCDAHEGHVAEREQAGVARKELQPDHQDQVGQHDDEDALEHDAAEQGHQHRGHGQRHDQHAHGEEMRAPQRAGRRTGHVRHAPAHTCPGSSLGVGRAAPG